MKKLRFQFGPFHLDTADHLFLRNGKPLPLAPKAFDTLVYLAENYRRLVTRDELIKAVWPNSFVEDGSLSVNISLVRRALGEMEDGEPYIETVPRKGYRFRPLVTIEPVAENLPPLVPSPGESLPAPISAVALVPVRKSVFGSLPIGFLTAFSCVLLGLFVMGAVMYLFSNGRKPPVPFASMRISHLATRGTVSDAAISADGKYVAYALNEAQGQSLWLRQIAAPSDVRIVSAESGEHSNLIVSPDGTYLYYVRVGGNGAGTLYRMPLLGGDSIKVVDGVTGVVGLSPDGEQLAFIRMDPSRWAAAVMVTNVDGSKLRQIASRHRPRYLSLKGLSWSADGRFIFCSAGSASEYDVHAFHLVRIRVADGAESAVTSQSWAWTGAITRSSSDDSLFLAGSEQAEDALQIWRVSLRDGKPSQVTNDLSNYATLSLSSNGKIIAAVRADKSADLWVAPATDIQRPVPITSGDIQGLNNISWTPGGKIAYSARSADYVEIFLTGADGGDSQQLTAEPSNKVAAAFTRDGKYVLCQSRGRIWRMDADGSNQLQLTHGAHDVHPVPSADGRSVIYASFADWSPAIGGKPTLWKVSIDGGQPSELTDVATSLPQISPDGKLIACAYFPGEDPRFSQRQIVVFNFAGGAPLEVFNRPSSATDPVYWAPDGKSLDYVVTDRRVGNIWRQPLNGAPPVQLTHFNVDELFDFAWSPDGRLAVARGKALDDLVLIRDAGSQ